MTDTNDTTRIDEIAALAAGLFFLVPPARALIAPQLHDLGWRVHPELATKRLVSEGPAMLGNHAPQRMESIGAADALRAVNPELADRIAAARAAAAAGDPTAAQALAAELRTAIATDSGVLGGHAATLAADIAARDAAQDAAQNQTPPSSEGPAAP